MVSVIIPTKNNTKVLQECLKSLQQLDYPKELLEILVIIDSHENTDDSNAENDLKNLISKFPIFVFQMNGTPSYKRNYGVNKAKGSIIAFIDSDCIAPPQWVSKAAKYFEDPSVAVVGGPNLTPHENNWRQKTGGNIFASKLGTGPMRARYTPVGETRITKGLEIILCNMFARKSTFEMLQGFDEQLFPNEENEFLHRIRTYEGTNTQKIIYDPTIFVYHHRRPIILKHSKQVFNYGVGRGKMIRIHPITAFPASPLMVSFVFLAIAFPALLIYQLITLVCSWCPNIPFSWQIIYFLTILFIVYFVGTIAYGIKWTIQQKRIPLLFITPLVFFLSHFAYGCGIVKGLLS